MKLPVIFVDAVVFPGLPGQVPVEAQIGQMLMAYGQYMGFGAQDVLLAFPANDSAAAGPQNHCAVGALVEVTVNPDEPELLILHGGARVRLASMSQQGPDHRSGWSGSVAEAAPASPAATGVDETRLKAFQTLFAKWLLADPVPHGAEEHGLVRAIVDPIVEMGRHKSTWKTVYLVAEFLLEDTEARRSALQADDLQETFGALEKDLGARLGRMDSDDIEAHFGALLEELVEPGLQDVVDGLSAARRLSAMGAVTLPGGVGKALRGVQRDLERITERLSSLADTLSEDWED